MTLSKLERQIQLKVRFTDGTHDVRTMFWLPELAVRDDEHAP